MTRAERLKRITEELHSQLLDGKSTHKLSRKDSAHVKKIVDVLRKGVSKEDLKKIMK